MNNKKYTIKYIGDRIRQKNQEKEFSNSNLINYNNKNIIPINNFNDIYNKSSSYLNKVNIASKNENNKNQNNRKTSTQNFKKINIIEKEKENKDINEYRINNLSSSYNIYLSLRKSFESFLYSGFFLRNSSKEIWYKSLILKPRDVIVFIERGLLF